MCVSRPETLSGFAIDESRDTLMVSGEVDAAGSAGALLASILAGNGNADRRVDLSSVTFLDSAGLHALLNARKELGEQNRRLLVLNRSEAVERVLELTGLPDVFDHD
jgi:anti-sigma B factor antagonist